MLRPTVSWPVCFGIKHPFGAYDHNYGFFFPCGAPSLTRGRVWLLYMLLALARAIVLWSEPRGSRDQILLSHSWDFPFRRLLRLAGSRWRYLIPPPQPPILHHGKKLSDCLPICLCFPWLFSEITSGSLDSGGLHVFSKGIKLCSLFRLSYLSCAELFWQKWALKICNIK
jgi:hypothetical protein